MTRKAWLWLSASVILTVLIAYQVVITSAGDRDREFAACADVPTMQPGVDVLGGITLMPWRARHFDGHRSAFGEAVQIDHVSSAALRYEECVCTAQHLDDMPLAAKGIGS